MNVSQLSLGEFNVQVCFRKEMLSSPWQPFKWTAYQVLPSHTWNDTSGDEVALHTTLRVFQDEVQGYFLNLDAPSPQIYFLLRFPDDDQTKYPAISESTLSYEEAARWMDSNEEVQSVSMPEPIAAWLSEMVQERFKPEPKRRRRPQSFVAPENR